MARTNLKAPITHTTHEGAPARHLTAEQELRRSVLACLLWEDQFYESGQDIGERIRDLSAKVPAEKVAVLAIEAREQQHLRHAPLWLARALAGQRYKGTADVLARVIQRADELAEFVSLYWKDGKQPLAAQVKRGLARAFTKFDAYQLAKYDRPGAVRVRDVLFLCHAKPKNAEQAATWKQLVDGTLPSPDTWEVALSSGADKRATWERLIGENRLGGLAILRNLRNMQEQGVGDAVIRSALANGNFGRVLPFRFLAAAKYAPKFEPELEAAMFRAVGEMPKLQDKTVLLVDRSSSMAAPISERSDLTRYEVACALAVLLREVCEDVAILTFASPDLYRHGDGRQRDHVKTVPTRRGFALRDAMGHPGGGTHTEDGKQAADREGYDRLILLTDEQSHQAISAPNGKGYVVNVASYQRGIGYGSWVHIDGWSESVVSYIGALEGAEAR